MEFVKPIKKPVANRSSQQALPLRHIELIAIWEGNYKSDIFNIGFGERFLERAVEKHQNVAKTGLRHLFNQV